ncbi:hypothetical protein GALL_457530 [mine drainage metagenome]|uniref:Uncharacterized protein n=1 Tax=mine drainage metagenome TaxID=410659 RepID=A0A1J5PM86_9ZZZZ
MGTPSKKQPFQPEIEAAFPAIEGWGVALDFGRGVALDFEAAGFGDMETCGCAPVASPGDFPSSWSSLSCSESS